MITIRIAFQVGGVDAADAAGHGRLLRNLDVRHGAAQGRQRLRLGRQRAGAAQSRAPSRAAQRRCVAKNEANFCATTTKRVAATTHWQLIFLFSCLFPINVNVICNKNKTILLSCKKKYGEKVAFF
jgi:hypothetical protein